LFNDDEWMDLCLDSLGVQHGDKACRSRLFALCGTHRQKIVLNWTILIWLNGDILWFDRSTFTLIALLLLLQKSDLAV